MFCYFKQEFINNGIQMSDTNSDTNFLAPDILSGTPVKVIFRFDKAKQLLQFPPIISTHWRKKQNRKNKPSSNVRWPK